MCGVNDGVEEMAAAWQTAAADLGIKVTAPFQIGDSDLTCAAWIAGFGAAPGTLAAVLGAQNQGIRAFADSQGMSFSELSSATYSRYDRAAFVEALDDWGWHGDPTEAPDWYTGERWTT